MNLGGTIETVYQATCHDTPYALLKNIVKLKSRIISTQILG